MKKAFSLLELVFVILIFMMVFKISSPYFTHKQMLAGAKQLINDIHYTRALAMMQNELRAYDLSITKKGKDYFKTRWQLYFIRSSGSTQSMQTYTLFIDKNGDGNANLYKTNPKKREIASAVADSGKLMSSGQSGILTKDQKQASIKHNIERMYGIKDILLRGACKNLSGHESTRIAFDSHGRLLGPLRMAYRQGSSLLLHRKGPCILVLIGDKKKLCIQINTLSGHAKLARFISEDAQVVDIDGKLVMCDSLK